MFNLLNHCHLLNLNRVTVSVLMWVDLPHKVRDKHVEALDVRLLRGHHFVHLGGTAQLSTTHSFHDDRMRSVRDNGTGIHVSYEYVPNTAM